VAQNSESDATKTAGNACLKDRQFSGRLRRIFNDLEGAVFDAPVAPLCSRGIMGFWPLGREGLSGDVTWGSCVEAGETRDLCPQLRTVFEKLPLFWGRS